MESEKEFKREDEIDLVELARVIWSRRWFIIKVTGFFVALGLLIAFTSPKEYETSCTLIPEAMDGGSGINGSLGGLAALAGVDLGGMAGGGSTINPALYRSVAQSTPFLLELMKQKFYFNELGKQVSLYGYYMEYYNTSLVSKIISAPFFLMGWFSGEEEEADKRIVADEVLFLTKYQELVVNDLKERILVTMDWELNLVTIEVEMQDPQVAAEVGKFTQNYITDYVTNYAVSKSREQLKYLEAQYLERKVEFLQEQVKLAQFRDRNLNIHTAQAKSEEERLQSQYNLAFNVYNQLAQQRETLKLKVNENTPVFTILEPVRVPVSKSSPKRKIILLVSIFVGLCSAIFWVAVKDIIYRLTEK